MRFVLSITALLLAFTLPAKASTTIINGFLTPGQNGLATLDERYFLSSGTRYSFDFSVDQGAITVQDATISKTQFLYVETAPMDDPHNRSPDFYFGYDPVEDHPDVIHRIGEQRFIIGFAIGADRENVYQSGLNEYTFETFGWQDVFLDLKLNVATSVPVSYSLAILATPIPEPATWAMLILGFGAVGAAMRRRRFLLSHGERIRSLGRAAA